MFISKFLDCIFYGGYKTIPKDEKHHLMNLSPRLGNQKSWAEHVHSSSCFLNVNPVWPGTSCSYDRAFASRMDCIPSSYGLDIPFFPSAALLRSWSQSNWYKWVNSRLIVGTWITVSAINDDHVSFVSLITTIWTLFTKKLNYKMARQFYQFIL